MGRAGTPNEQVFDLDEIVRHGFGDVADDSYERRSRRQLAVFLEQLDSALSALADSIPNSRPITELLDAGDLLLRRFADEHPAEAERLIDSLALWSLADANDLLLAEVSRRTFQATRAFAAGRGKDQAATERQIRAACEQVRRQLIETGLEALMASSKARSEGPFSFTTKALSRQIHLSHATVIAEQLYKLDPEKRLDTLFFTTEEGCIHFDQLASAIRVSGNEWPEEKKFAAALSTILMEADTGRRNSESEDRIVLVAHLACVAFPGSLAAYRDAVERGDRCLTFTSIWQQHYGLLLLSAAPGTVGSID